MLDFGRPNYPVCSYAYCKHPGLMDLMSLTETAVLEGIAPDFQKLDAG